MSKPVQAVPAYLAAPIDGTQTTFTIRGLKDSRGTPITAMISAKMHATIEPRSTANQEIVSWTGMNDLGNGIIQVTGVTRNLDPQPPYAALGNSVSHGSGAEIILSDTAAFWGEVMNSSEPATVTGLHTYSTRPHVTGADTDPDAVATLGDLAAAAISPGNIGNITVAATAGEALTAGQVVWLDPSVGRWKVANASVAAELSGYSLGIVRSSASSGAAITNGVTVLGRVAGFTGLAVGAVYVSNSGAVSNTAGTSTRQIGVAVSSTEIIFDPYAVYIPSTAEKTALTGLITPPTVQVFTASGTWTKPSGVKYIEVEVLGGGGGGGSDNDPSSTSSSRPGGGAGGYAKKTLLAASLLLPSETVTVGAAGLGVMGSDGTSGGTSSFGAHVSATGGAGSGSRTGGIGTGGDINIPGQDGQPAQVSDSTNNTYVSGAGGDAPLGYGAGGRGQSTTSNADRNGENATGYGAGGGGSIASTSGADPTGGNGTQGIVIVRSFF